MVCVPSGIPRVACLIYAPSNAAFTHISWQENADSDAAAPEMTPCFGSYLVQQDRRRKG